jgi:methylmalonyl-CoA mutase N-terminal domain/subunit
MNDCQDAEIVRLQESVGLANFEMGRMTLELAHLKAEAVRAWDNARQREEERDQARAALSAMTTERNALLKATNEHTGSCFSERDQLRATIADLTTALEEIARGRGAYSHDPMEHGENCINHMKQTANDALARAKESK